MKLSYFLRPRPDSKGLCSINLIYRNEGIETYLPTGRKVAEKYFNYQNKNGTWILSAYGEAQPTFNLALKKLLNDTEDKINRFYLDNGAYPTREQVKRLFAGETERTHDVFKLFAQFIRYQSGERGVGNVSDGTVGNYMNAMAKLREYQEHTGKPLLFTSINHTFYDSFVKYFSVEKKCATNTIGSYVKTLKSFLNWANIHHDIQIDKATLHGMKVISEQNFFAWINKDELDYLISFDLSAYSTELIHSRDAFALQCCLGVRYNDMKRAIAENIVFEGGRYFFKIKTQKNEKLIIVPLSNRASSILAKYVGIPTSEWMPTISKCNLNIKEVCRLAGICESVQVLCGTGDNRTYQIKPKWQLLSTHSARRSFINTMLADGVNEHVIAAMTGQSIQTIQGYKMADTRDIVSAIEEWDRK